ncbi:steroid delta-isomerase [Maribacter algarum]|uniref:Steroid delta-isomerase n=1 Tax=Maribacter algarum (ex Zhang et al. 2020) TaxID=2578118 RepID=A0A5S3PHI8_9FLAO|nr:nuclear transport factor 2 family protein [Maribacter algarum]TMM53740.1 steroid delta-isomerase [Maribacter algarum]
MKNILTLTLFLISIQLFAQPNTEVYLLDINNADGRLKLSNLRNISNNEGYDNQPSFYDENTILFASTRNEQTDIAQYNIKSSSISWVNDTAGGGEYSPLRIPNSTAISAVRLDTTGLQRLYQYDTSNGVSKVIRKDAKVGYHVWYSDEILINTILVENRMDLVISHLKDGTNTVAAKNVGRSLHKIPNTELVSYIAKEQGNWFIKSLHPISGATEIISQLPPKTEDMAWMADGSVLVPAGNILYRFKPESKENPESIILSEYEEINSISRMAISPDGKYLALVSQEPPSKIVQKQVDSYNAGDLNAFVNCYSENVLVTNFPSDTLYVGHEKMRRNYSSLSPDNKVYEVEVVNRITIGNKVIDQEKVTKKGVFQQFQVALYEVENDDISSMRFIFDDNTTPNPETIVQKQLDEYNTRDIDGFLQTYTEDVELFNFPEQKRSKGQEEMRKGYAGFFESTPDLHCEIKNRITIRNIVIDEEYITANGNNFSAVAIYEVENGKISKVTFVR